MPAARPSSAPRATRRSSWARCPPSVIVSRPSAGPPAAVEARSSRSRARSSTSASRACSLSCISRRTRRIVNSPASVKALPGRRSMMRNAPPSGARSAWPHSSERGAGYPSSASVFWVTASRKARAGLSCGPSSRRMSGPAYAGGAPRNRNAKIRVSNPPLTEAGGSEYSSLADQAATAGTRAAAGRGQRRAPRDCLRWPAAGRRPNCDHITRAISCTPRAPPRTPRASAPRPRRCGPATRRASPCPSRSRARGTPH